MLIPGHRYRPAQVLPHAGDMCLIDRIEDYGPDWVQVGIDVAGRGLFEEADGRVPAWLGVEYVAQAAAAYAGIEQVQSGVPVNVGLLIGMRSYQSRRPWFEAGWQLSATATLQLRDGDELAVFDCVIRHHGQEIARGDVKAFRPADLDLFIRSRT